MRFSTYNCDNDFAAPTFPRSNMLVLFIDSNNPCTDDPMDVIFEEAIKLASDGANVWAAMRLISHNHYPIYFRYIGFGRGRVVGSLQLTLELCSDRII